MTPDQDDAYRCQYCGQAFPVAVMTTHHQAENQCGLVPAQERPSCDHQQHS